MARATLRVSSVTGHDPARNREGDRDIERQAPEKGPFMASDLPRSTQPPQPIRDGQGASILGPTNPPREAQSPDVLVPPPTDAGTLPTCGGPSPTATSAGGGRLVAADDDPRDPRRHRHRPGQHAAQGRRGPRAALAQAGRVGLHAQGPGADHRHRRDARALPGRRRRRRPVELPLRHPALDPGPRGRRLRVPARLRRRQLQRRRDVLGHRLAGPYPEGGPGQELRRARERLRRHPRQGALHLPVEGARPARRGPGRRRRAGAHVRSATGCSPRSRSAPRAARSASRTRPRSRRRRRSPPRSSKSSPAACARCTGTRTRTRRSTTSPARRG